MRRSILLAASASIFAAPAVAETPRTDKVLAAHTHVFSACPMTPRHALQKQREAQQEALPLIIGTLLAGIAGDLVKTGLSAAGEALEAASREQGFVAQGQGPYFAGTVTKAKSVSDPARFEPGERCLVLYLPAKDEPIDKLFSEAAADRPEETDRLTWQRASAEAASAPETQVAPAESERDAAANAEKEKEEKKTKYLDEETHSKRAWINTFEELGIINAPSIYVEARLMPSKEGLQLVPTFVWYRKAFKGAPKAKAKAEMHLSLATPKFEAGAAPGAIGTVFSGARLALPEISPGEILDGEELRGTRSAWLPNRPTEGYVDDLVEAKNALLAGVSTKKAELDKAKLAEAKAKRLADKKPNDLDLAYAYKEAERERKAIEIASIATSEQWSADSEAVRAGATNVQMRFVVIRDANKFGLALAKALGNQAEAAGKAVTEELTPQGPKPEWSADKTAYITAMEDVAAKQRAYDAALAKGESEPIAVAAADLKISKAKANEAAVKLKMVLPYPGLF